MICLGMHSNVMLRFMVQAFQDPPLCSSTQSTCRCEDVHGPGVRYVRCPGQWSFKGLQRKQHSRIHFHIRLGGSDRDQSPLPPSIGMELGYNTVARSRLEFQAKAVEKCLEDKHTV
jgi:hypothetical protein